MGVTDSGTTFTWKGLNRFDLERWAPLGTELWWIDADGPIREITLCVASLSDDFGKLIQGKLKSEGIVRFIRPGIPQEISRLGYRASLTYEGALLVEELSEFIGESTSRTVFRYDSLERRIEQEAYASHGELTGRRVFEYGTEGDFKAVKFEAGGGKTICEYNRYGQIVRSTHLPSDGSASYYFFWRYDQSHRMLETGSSLSSGRMILHYNEAGQLIECQDRWDSRSETATGWLKTFGRRLFPKALRYSDTKDTFRYLDPNLKNRTTNIYDQKGNVTKRTWYEVETEKRGKKWIVTGERIVDLEGHTYEYDAVGNWTKRTTSKLDEDAKRCKPSQVAVRSIIYFE